MRKTILLMSLIFFLAVSVGQAATVTVVTVFVDGKEVSFPDQSPYIDNGTTLIPVRFVSEALGAKVDWDDATKKVTVTQDSKKIVLQLNNKKVENNGKNFDLEVPAKLTTSGRTVVPLRFVSEALGANVTWIDSSNIVQIQTIAMINTVPENVQAIKKIIEEEPTFASGKTMIGRKGEVLFDPTGGGNLKDMSLVVSEKDASTVVLSFQKFTDKEKAILKTLLSKYYPNEHEKAYEYVLSMQPVKETLDGKIFLSNKSLNGSPVLWIGVN